MAKIKTRSTYYDTKSFEALTQVTKPKYKLAGCYPPGVDGIPFFLVTTNEHLKKDCVVEIKKSDWQNRDRRFLRAPKSFVDVRNIEILTRSQIKIKKQEPGNGFRYVAQLSNDKFDELKKVGRSVYRTGYIHQSKIKIITDALTEAQIAKNNLQRLGLNS